MTEPTFVQSPPTPPSRGRGRLIGFSIASATAGLLALAFLAAGAGLLYVDAKKDDDGYYTTSTERFHAGSYAIASGDVDLDGAGDIVDDIGLGRVRLHAQSNGDKPVFIGIARSEDADRYLRGTDHTIVTDIDGGGPFGDDFDPEYRSEPGARRPAPPARSDIWAASSTGTGEQTVEWKIRDGNWSIVVMNADASRDVDSDISAGAKLPFVGPAGWTSLGIGIFAAVTSAALLLLGFRGPKDQRPAPATPAEPQPQPEPETEPVI
jgi:hypothetical protein